MGRRVLAHIADRGEVGDLCDYGGEIGSGGGIPMFGSTIERVFSNARAATGHDPTRSASSQLGDKVQLISSSSEAAWPDSLFVGQ